MELEYGLRDRDLPRVVLKFNSRQEAQNYLYHRADRFELVARPVGEWRPVSEVTSLVYQETA